VSSTNVQTCGSLFGGERADATATASAGSNSAITAEGQEPEASVFYYVSSRHLKLASPWFRRALAKEQWAESERDEKDNLIIFHLRNRKIPRQVSLDDLAKIAVLVDYYECAEAVEHFTEKWKENLMTLDPIPSTYCRTLTLWIWIAWVFEFGDDFQNATLVAVKQCSEPMPTLGLPIPDIVSGRIPLL
jgi:hypothetical protein